MSDKNIITLNSLLPTINRSIGRNKTYVGIDFGTSTTVASIAYYEDNEVKVIKVPIKQMDKDGAIATSDLVPTAIAWWNGRLLVGRAAADLKYDLIRDEDVWYSFKMQLGNDFVYNNSKTKDFTDKKAAFKIETPKDAASVFFMYLKRQIENFCQSNNLSTNIEYAVSIPASFEANQRKDLLEALDKNGMNLVNQCLIDEPNAAFLGYLQNSITSRRDEDCICMKTYNPKVLVFDFGAGTCDISILELGMNNNGFFSKNIAISRFSELGGDDIDRYIAYHYLMPELLRENGKQKSDFRLPDLKHIASQLYKTAEQLKILICQDITNKMGSSFKLPDWNNEERTVRMPVSIETKEGILTKEQFSLSYDEFNEVMDVFTADEKTEIEGENTYYNIFDPIENAIEKAKVKKSELDYILFVGGSCKNPFIQVAISEYFEDADMIRPANMQTLVSEGASIHSLILNGFGKSIISPISSEPIFLITEDEKKPKILLPAGSVVPSGKIMVNNLMIQKAGQQSIELPICVGSRGRILYNLILRSSDKSGFSKENKITVVFEIDVDKQLHVSASCGDISVKAEPQNPFSNTETTPERYNVIKVEREFNAEKIGGIYPSKSAYDRLVEAYKQAGLFYLAADTLEQKKQIYNESVSWNAIGLLYGKFGDSKNSLRCYEKAQEENPNNWVFCFNVAIAAQYIDDEKYRKNIEKGLELNPDEPLLIYQKAKILENDGYKEESEEEYQYAFDILNEKFESNKADDCDKSWLQSLARKVGRMDVVKRLNEDSKNRLTNASDKPFDKNNLVKEINN